MPRRFSTKTSLFLIIGSGIVVLTMVAGVGLLYIHRVKKNWDNFIHVVQGKERHLMTIRELMGYGGAIHNFKNYVLRGDTHYFDSALSQLQGTLTAIDAYHALGPLKPIEESTLERVREMAMAYSNATLRVRDLHARHMEAAEIDRLVRIDDTPHLVSMAALTQELMRLTSVKSKRVSRQVSSATILLSVIACSGGLFFLFLGASLKRGIEGTDQALRAENLERQQVEVELKQSQSTLRQSELQRDHFVESAFFAQEEERRRLARELHDEAGQSLSSLIVGLQQIKEATSLVATQAQADKLQSIAEGVIDEVARMARRLHPRLLEDLGFTDAIEHQASEIQRIHNLEVQVQVVGLEQSPLPMPVATALYRIIQEALTNVVKHANANAVNLVVSRDPSNVRVIIEDDGCGFVPEEDSSGMGLLGIGERVKMLDGTLDIESSPDSGTTLAVRIPLKEVKA